MAPRKSSRRAQPLSDIEDNSQPSTSQRRAEAVDDDEVEPSSQPKKVKVKRQKNDPQDDDDDKNDSDEDLFDIDNFQDQAWAKADIVGIKDLVGDWVNVRDTVKHTSGDVFTTTVAALFETESADVEEQLQNVDVLMREVIDIQRLMVAHEEALTELQQKGLQEKEAFDMVGFYDDMAQRKMDEYLAKTSRQKYAKDEQYQNFKEAVHDGKDDRVAMPPMTELIPKEAGDESDDDDVEIGGMTQDFKCPISLRPLENPMTSETCKHTFSSGPLREYFGGSQGPKPCPATACSSHFRLSQCHADKNIERRAKAALKRQKRREEHSDAEEVIE